MLKAPNEDDITRLARSWIKAQELVALVLPEAELDQSESDLVLVQELLDRKLLAPSQTYELQCLGVALGRVLARNVDGLDWAVIVEGGGRDPTLRYKNTTLQLNVLTMISKRVEQGQTVDVRNLYDSLRAHVERLKSKVD